MEDKTQVIIVSSTLGTMATIAMADITQALQYAKLNHAAAAADCLEDVKHWCDQMLELVCDGADNPAKG